MPQDSDNSCDASAALPVPTQREVEVFCTERYGACFPRNWNIDEDHGMDTLNAEQLVLKLRVHTYSPVIQTFRVACAIEHLNEAIQEGELRVKSYNLPMTQVHTERSASYAVIELKIGLSSNFDSFDYAELRKCLDEYFEKAATGAAIKTEVIGVEFLNKVTHIYRRPLI